MSEIENGGPAFPIRSFDARDEQKIFYGQGMSLRDYFAAKVLPTLIAKAVDLMLRGAEAPSKEEFAKSAAHEAYEFADAMIAERGKQALGCVHDWVTTGEIKTSAPPYICCKCRLCDARMRVFDEGRVCA